MTTATQEEKTAAAAAKAAEEAKAAKAAEAKAEKERKAAEREEAKAAKAKEREEAKAAKEKERVEARAKVAQEKIDKVLTELPTGQREALIKTGNVTLESARAVVKAFKAEERANRPKKANLTLSQRRAVLKLGEAPITPANAFNATPLDYLVSVGLAQSKTVSVDEPYTEKEDQEVEIPEADRKEGGPTTKTTKVAVTKTRSVNRQEYSLTETGVARAKELNPKWRDWKPDHTSAPDVQPASQENAA